MSIAAVITFKLGAFGESGSELNPRLAIPAAAPRASQSQRGTERESGAENPAAPFDAAGACSPKGEVYGQTTLVMAVVAAVQRRGRVGEHLVIGNVVGAHAINAVRHADDQRAAQVADESSDTDVDDVVSKATAVGPAAGNGAAAKTGLLRNEAALHS